MCAVEFAITHILPVGIHVIALNVAISGSRPSSVSDVTGEERDY